MGVWNRCQKRDRWGRKRYLVRPEDQWIRLDAPELRIVEPALWQAAHARIAQDRAMYAGTGGRAPLDREGLGRRYRPQRAIYLLSGIAKCAECGGSLVAFTRDMKKAGRRALYGCMYSHSRGTKVCANRLLIRQEKLDRVVLDAIAEALDERILERAVARAADKVARRRRSAPDRLADIDRDLADVEGRLQRGLDAILAAPEVADELRARLRTEKHRKATLLAERDAIKARGRGGVADLDERRIVAALHASLRDVRGLLGNDIPRTREILQRVLVEPLACRAFNEGGRVGYAFKTRGSYAALLPADARPILGVTPAGCHSPPAARAAPVSAISRAVGRPVSGPARPAPLW